MLYRTRQRPMMWGVTQAQQNQPNTGKPLPRQPLYLIPSRCRGTPVSFQYALIVCIVAHIWRKPHPCMLWEMFLPSTFGCPPLCCNCPMIPIKNHQRALCVTSNDNQKRSLNLSRFVEG